MRIQAEEHRLYWKIVGVGIIVDLIGAAVVAGIIQKLDGANAGSFWAQTGIAWLFIEAFRIIIGILNIARLWAAKELGAFKSSGESFHLALQQGELPMPDSYTHSVDAYLSATADDEDQPARARIVAASLWGVRQGTKNLGILHSVFLDSAHEEALKRFASEGR